MQNTTVIITSKFAQEEGKSLESQKFWDAKILRCKPFEQASPPTPWIWTHEHEHMYNSPSQYMHNGFNVRANQGRREKYEVAWTHTSGMLLILFCILIQERICSHRSNSIQQSHPKAEMFAQKHLALKLIKFCACRIYKSTVHIIRALFKPRVFIVNSLAIHLKARCGLLWLFQASLGSLGTILRAWTQRFFLSAPSRTCHGHSSQTWYWQSVTSLLEIPIPSQFLW